MMDCRKSSGEDYGHSPITPAVYRSDANLEKGRANRVSGIIANALQRLVIALATAKQSNIPPEGASQDVSLRMDSVHIQAHIPVHRSRSFVRVQTRDDSCSD